MAESMVDQTLAEAERRLTEKEKLHSSLSSYDLDPDVKDYKYTNLRVPSTDDPDYRDKKRFRLLNLMSGFLDSPTVYCEIFEVEVNIAKDEVFIVPDVDFETSESPSPVSSKNISYEALSWRWGNESKDEFAIIIKTKDGERKKRVSYTLGLALKYLRYQTKPRMIWIDALCINQANFDERSSQVAMMDRLYTGASQICVWLGQDDSDSRKAIKFIKEEINELRDFDKLCKNSKHAEKWRALLGLMQRDWFSRRWVVQELALARRATVYCGPDQIEWRELAIAIELFVEVESATHRLSELMKKDDRFNVIPNWFEHISELGASLLVTETSKIFRDYKRESDHRPLGLSHLSMRGPGRRSLLSLEYLVTSLSIFDCGRPHDFVYALITISRDAFPSPPTSITQRSKESLVTEVMKGFVERKPFPLDYDIPYPDVARDFIEFTIQRHVDTGKDEEKALDILCRPWSKDWRPEDERSQYHTHETQKNKRLFGEREAGKKWRIISVDDQQKRKYEFKHAPPDARQREDPEQTMVEWWEKAKREGEKIIPEQVYKKKWRPWFRNQSQETTVDKQVAAKQDVATTTASARTSKANAPEVHLPSWVSDVTKAPFDIFPHPGVEMTKMGRKNADPLVGSLDNRTGTYSAAQSKKQDSKEIKFKKRSRLDHYSLYVRGFCFDKVDIVEQVSQQGAIPASWLKLGGWEKAIRPKSPGADPGIPPDALWRTLVADRGMHNQNPPYYYSRACRETIMKGALRSNAVDTTALIYNERNSIIAEFCRRTQCVIWNRAMIRTQNGSLGLVAPNVRKGDLVCIIYGCTVPVILRRAKRLKTGEDRRNEMKDDCLETFKCCFKKCLQRRARKFEYKKQNIEHVEEVREDLSLWKAKLQAQRMLKFGIEESDLECWSKTYQAQVQTGSSDSEGDGHEGVSPFSPPGTPPTLENLSSPGAKYTGHSSDFSHQYILAELQNWTNGHPWEKQCDDIAIKIGDLEEKAKFGIMEWKESTEVKQAFKNAEVKAWLEQIPSEKIDLEAVNRWLGMVPDAFKEASEPLRPWLWSKMENRRLRPSKFDHDAAKPWLDWLEARPWKSQGMNTTGTHPDYAMMIDREKLEKDIRRWKEAKSFLDKVVESREEIMVVQQEEKLREELRDWKKKWEDQETKRKAQAKGEKTNPNRWSQLPSKAEMGLTYDGRNSCDSGRFSSDEESDEDTDQELEDLIIPSLDVEDQESDSEPDEKARESCEKRATLKRRLGKKRRQQLADERDPFRHYEFLGEAYIHGMMEGEAVSQGFYKKKPEHLFELR